MQGKSDEHQRPLSLCELRRSFAGFEEQWPLLG